MNVFCCHPHQLSFVQPEIGRDLGKVGHCRDINPAVRDGDDDIGMAEAKRHHKLNNAFHDRTPPRAANPRR